MTELEKVTRELEATRAARDELLRANAALSSTAHEAGKALTEALNTVAECENEAQWQERERKRLAGAVGRFVQEAIKVPSADRAYLVIVMPEEHFREELDKARQRGADLATAAIFGDEFLSDVRELATLSVDPILPAHEVAGRVLAVLETLKRELKAEHEDLPW